MALFGGAAAAWFPGTRTGRNGRSNVISSSSGEETFVDDDVLLPPSLKVGSDQSEGSTDLLQTILRTLSEEPRAPTPAVGYREIPIEESPIIRIRHNPAFAREKIETHSDEYEKKYGYERYPGGAVPRNVEGGLASFGAQVSCKKPYSKVLIIHKSLVVHPSRCLTTATASAPVPTSPSSQSSPIPILLP